MGRQIIVPLGLAVSIEDFAAVYNTVEQRFLADRDSVYLGAALSCFHWVVGTDGYRTPMTGLARPFTPETASAEMWSAVDIVLRGSPGNADWALPVMNTLGWLLGVRKSFPIRL